MLGIQKIERLAEWLGLTEGELLLGAEYGHEDIREYTVWPPKAAKKPRDVVAVGGRLRRIQCRLLKRVFQPALMPSPYSHGGVRGRHPLSNARVHFRNRFGLKVDVAAFYPSLTNWRINRLLLHRLRCSPPVARILTGLCTYKHHLALGLVTSPILADQVMVSIDDRMAQMCMTEGLRFSRFVDDITISGNFDLERSGIQDCVREILASCGLHTNDKTEFGRIGDGFEITGVRLKNGHADMGRKYIAELTRLLDDHHSLAANGPFQGPLMTSSQLEGKVFAAIWINPGRRASLLRRVRSICWEKVIANAAAKGLVHLVERIAPRGAPRPDPAEPVATPAGRRFDQSKLTVPSDRADVLPFDAD